MDALARLAYLNCVPQTSPSIVCLLIRTQMSAWCTALGVTSLSQLKYPLRIPSVISWYPVTYFVEEGIHLVTIGIVKFWHGHVSYDCNC